ncbi:sensor histidine kinase [Nocardia takedensis]
MAALRPLADTTTYSRGVHLCVPLALVAIWAFIDPAHPYVIALLLVPAGLLSVTRLAEGVQAQLLLTPRERGRHDASITVSPATTWSQRWRTVLWLEVRLACAAALLAVGVPMVWICADLIRAAASASPTRDTVFELSSHWGWAVLVPVPIAVFLAAVVILGATVTAAARRLLGPAPAERLRLLEQRTEQLLEHNRLARDVHDSVGHALTAMVLQATAASAGSDAGSTRQALRAVEDTGRAALDDLDRMLGLLRDGQSWDDRPTLTAMPELFEAARAAGATMEVVIDGAIETVPAPISREVYRILQESLTNALRHCGPVPVQVTVGVDATQLELTVANPLPDNAHPSRPGSGLTGIRERVQLLGGLTRIGTHGSDWQVHAEIPLR